MRKRIPLVLLTILFCAVSCNGDRTPLTQEVFAQTMREKELQIADATTQFPSEIAENVTIARNGNYQIEFYILTSEETAHSSFGTNKDTFLQIKESSSFTSNSSVTLPTYEYYSLTTNDRFYYVSRVKHTMVFIDVEKAYKEEVQAILKDLGY